MKRIFIILMSLFLFVACKPEERNITFAKEWGFALDPGDKGESEKWYTRPLKDRINLPGSLQEQGYGLDVSPETVWTGDRKVSGTAEESPVYEKYKKAGSIKIPSWLQPVKHYAGAAWYQQEVVIPREEAGDYVLELERPHWETSLFVDDRKVGSCDSLSVPHRYVLKDMKPGKHLLTVRVDNRVRIPVGVNAHSVSDHTQSNWNGLVGKLELSKRSSASVDEVRITPDVKAKSVLVKTAVRRNPAEDSILRLEVLDKDGSLVTSSPEKIVKAGEGCEDVETRLELGDEAVLWSEHTPHVYQVRSVLSTGDEKESRLDSFGLRDFKANGTRFELNGRPVFLRGTLECCIFPLTGYPATDEAYWEKIYKTVKDFGLNHVRFHSWCPPKAAFDVADRMGVYLQVECGAWTSVGDGTPVDEWLYKEGDRILKEYGNHPSFCLMAYGNEPGGGKQVEYLSRLVDSWKKKDSRRVYTGAAGWPYLENADYWNAPDPRIQGWGAGLNSIINAQAPRTDYDFAHIIRKNMPTVSHEIGQWCVYPNFKEIDKYKGVLKAKNFELFREVLESRHMGDLADKFLYASGRLQTLCYKADIEAALRTPGMAGFQLLDLHDFPGQGTALVGVLDAFWDTKGYVDAAEYSTFCNDTVPLARFPKMVWSNKENMDVPVEVAHFGKESLKDARFAWSVATRDGQVLAGGEFSKDVPVGNGTLIGHIKCSFESLTKPEQLTVSVRGAGAEGHSFENRWNVWVYPSKLPAVKEMPYVTNRFDQETKDRLSRGEKVLFTLSKGKLSSKSGGNIAVGFSTVFWNTAWTSKQPPHVLGVYCDPEHPALASFPNQGYSDYQWWDVVTGSHAMILDDFPKDFRPIVHFIDDWFTNRKLGLLFEVKVGKGSLLVCSADLEKDLDKRPAARQFRQSLLEYMGSNRFKPRQEVPVALLEKLLTPDK